MTIKRKKRNLLPVFKDRRPAQLVFLFSLVIPILIAFAALVVMPVIQSTQMLKKTRQNAKSAPTLVPPDRESAHHMAALLADEAFLNSLYKMAQQDSISLCVDLSDSLVNLYIKGVTVRKCKMVRFRKSFAIRHFKSQDSLYNWLFPPFLVQKELATVPKSPIRTMRAPKDSNEARVYAQEEMKPVEERDVHFTLECSRGLYLRFEQTQSATVESWREKWRFELEQIFEQARLTIKALRQGKLPQHQLWIEMDLTPEDAKAVYRALPSKNALLALRL
jgi:hypothetical protein